MSRCNGTLTLLKRMNYIYDAISSGHNVVFPIYIIRIYIYMPIHTHLYLYIIIYTCLCIRER